MVVTDGDNVVGVEVNVPVVAELEREVSENEEDETHEYKAASRIVSLNPNEMDGKQGIQFIIAKEKLVVVTTDIGHLEFYFINKYVSVIFQFCSWLFYFGTPTY